MAGLSKLCPNQDLQCYFFQPSAVAALSATSATGFTVSGCWRQQFDWAVLEWNRDNVFEHAALRNLPDGDLSGIQLNYEETRTNCITLDSTWYPTVDWPFLRIWADSNGTETVYKVPLLNYATPAAGGYTAATVQFQLQGAPTAGDYVELAWLDQHFNYRMTATDMLDSALSALSAAISTAPNAQATATASGNQITLTYTGAHGNNGNRIGVYGTVSGTGTESWAPASGLFSGGASPSRWHISLDFSNLRDINGTLVPTSNVRKMRWTWAADIQPGNFTRSEFAVVVSNWTVTGTKLQYQVAGPGSWRIEDSAPEVQYQGTWTEARGNYSGGSIRWTTSPGAQVQCSYLATIAHTLYLGTRRADACGQISVQIDSNAPVAINLQLSGEDELVRIPIAQTPNSGTHTVAITYTGPPESCFYFDFLQIAVPSPDLPTFDPQHKLAMATDWDTAHSLALAPERTAWLIYSLGFRGRANHYAGALWFYELVQPDRYTGQPQSRFLGSPHSANTQRSHLGQGLKPRLSSIKP